MNYLMDASTLYRIVDTKRFDAIAGVSTLDLARYEIGNAVLKDLKYLKRITALEADNMIDLFSEVLQVVVLVAISDSKSIIKVADRFGLSFYDASYVFEARSLGLVLVTEDEKLRRKVGDYIKTLGLEDL
jgi:predicted nucleic acid-binding protein